MKLSHKYFVAFLRNEIQNECSLAATATQKLLATASINFYRYLTITKCSWIRQIK